MEVPTAAYARFHPGYGWHFMIRPAVLISRFLSEISSYVHKTTVLVDVSTLPYAFLILWLSA